MTSMFDLLYNLQIIIIIIIGKTPSQLISHTANSDHKMPTTFKTSLAQTYIDMICDIP